MTAGNASIGAGQSDLAHIVRQFHAGGEFTGAVPFGNGLIHRSLCVTVADRDAQRRFILQRINTRVFPRPIELMENIDRVTAHLAALARQSDPSVLNEQSSNSILDGQSSSYGFEGQSSSRTSDGQSSSYVSGEQSSSLTSDGQSSSHVSGEQSSSPSSDGQSSSHVLKGHGFSRAETSAQSDGALASEGRLPKPTHALTLVPALDGRSFCIDDEGTYWRMYRYIEGTRTVQQIESAQQCFQVARAFGEFQQQLTTLPPPRLHDTIPGFHDTPGRFAVLEQAIAADTAGRVKLAGPEIEFALARRSLAHVLLDAGLPERITHNDTKINNVLLDSATGEPVCVIDLDTVMPGLALYDFGDMVRTATCPAPEDERDLTRIYARFDYFEALARGYLAGAGAFLTHQEKQLLTAAGKLITFEQGVRFLADYLAGDKYYPVAHDSHNLDRCRTQWTLLESIEAQERPMNKVVASLM